MANLPPEIIDKVFALQGRLLAVINQATATSAEIMQTYGEIESTVITLEDLDSARDRANVYYTRLQTLLLRIAEAQPSVNKKMLELLERSIDEADATVAAIEATIIEERLGFNLP